jgi:hypothetical protein
MKRGKDVRDAKGEPIEPAAPNELTALKFVLVEVAPGAFKLRFVSNDDLIRDLGSQGALDTFLADADRLYAEFRSRFAKSGTRRPSPS